MPPCCRPWIRLGSLAAIAGITACRGDTVEPQVPDVTAAYWALALDHRAIALSTVAPHHTIQLTAVPRSPAGAELEGLPAPTYVSGNSEAVSVSATGLVTALAPAFGVPVIARLTTDGITHVDSAFVIALPEPAPTVASFSIQPLPGDSAKFAISGALLDPVRVLAPLALDDLGNPLLVSVHFRSLKHTIADIEPHTGQLKPVRRGNVTFIATTMAYGVALADTLAYTIGSSLIGGVRMKPTPGTGATHFSPSEVTIGTGGIIIWENFSGIPTDVTFDDPASAGAVPEHFDCVNGLPCDAGNIPAFGTSMEALEADPSLILQAYRPRRFSTPGTYTFRSAQFETTGRIIVLDEGQ